MLELILAVLLATGISAFCSVAEAVIYSVSWTYIERLKKKGKKSGPLLSALRHKVDEPITAVLTLNTVAHTVGAAVAGAAAAKLWGEGNLIYFSILFTLIILVFSEIIPKTIGVVYCRTLAPVFAAPLTLLVQLFKPLIFACRILVRSLEKKNTGPQASEEDLLATISLSRKTGAIEMNEEVSLQNILLLDKKIVRDVMTPRMVVFSLPAKYTVSEAKEAKHIWPHSRIPVFENDDSEDVVGVVYRREVLEALANDQDDLTLEELMKPVQFVLETLTLDKLLVQFLESRLHLFVVLDEYGGVAGVVTLEDVLEEILGREIVDETDEVADLRELARKRRSRLLKDRE